MTKEQLDNIIGFCFSFHPQLGNDLDSFDSSYLLEKWTKFIGVKPYNVEHLSLVYLKEDYEEFKKYKSKVFSWGHVSLPVGVEKKDLLDVYERMDWVNKWGEKGYNEVKEIIDIISRLGEKGIYDWTVQEIIGLFSDYVKIEQVSKEPYNHLHTLVKREMDKWINTVENKRDYNLILLEV